MRLFGKNAPLLSASPPGPARAGSALATCGADKTVRIWAPTKARGSGGAAAADAPFSDYAKQDHQQQQQQQKPEAQPYACTAVLEDSHTKTIRCAAWSHDGRHLATAGFDGITAIWERQGGVWESVSGRMGKGRRCCGAFRFCAPSHCMPYASGDFRGDTHNTAEGARVDCL
jgi:WD40 repeat protein